MTRLLNPEQLYELCARLVHDLIEMNASTAIELDSWPNAQALVNAVRPAPPSTLGEILEHAAGGPYESGRDYAERVLHGLRAGVERERRR